MPPTTADPFAGADFLQLRAFDDKDYTLHRSTWEYKLKYPERAHVSLNFHMIAETLKAPDDVRHSKTVPTCFIAFKRFDLYWIRQGVEAPTPPYDKFFAVVADRKRKIVKTFYPCKQPKKQLKVMRFR